MRQVVLVFCSFVLTLLSCNFDQDFRSRQQELCPPRGSNGVMANHDNYVDYQKACKLLYSCIATSPGTNEYHCVLGTVVECSAGQILCKYKEGTTTKTKCVDPRTDLQFCGARADCTGDAAGQHCAEGQTCENGHCTCPRGHIVCEGTCIDPLSNDDFCGAQTGCVGAQKCTTDADGNISKCVNGKCLELSCTGNKQLCPVLDQNGIATGQNECQDLKNDKMHCGACNFECNGSKYPNAKLADQACVGGICQYGCKQSYNNCGTEVEPLCLSADDMLNNHFHCGQCGVNCLSGAGIDAGDCVGGNCYCEGGTCKKAAVICDDGVCQLTAPTCINTETQCGKDCLDCTKDAIAERASCNNNGLCEIQECAIGYHLEKLSSGHTLCVANSDLACAPPNLMDNGDLPEIVNCTQTPNAKSSYCATDGYCAVSECNDGYYIVKRQGSADSCVPSSDFKCAASSSSQPVNCYESITNSVVTSCDKGKCIVKECAPGYHIGNDDKSCVANTKSACGLPDSNATVGCNDRCRLGICWRYRDKNNIYCGGGSGASIECWTDNTITRACIPKSDDMPPYACAYVCNDSGERERQRYCDGECLYLINGTDCDDCGDCTSGQTCYKDSDGNAQCRATLQPQV